jgi:WD40 repeat protein/serine/threonine protein kinase
MEKLIGQTIKDYELREHVASGGFGDVYRARQLSVQRDVAMKVITPKYANQPDFIRRFEAEAQIIARLESPYIVPLYNYWREPAGAYLVMRWLGGGSLYNRLHSQGALSIEEAVDVINNVTKALHIAHRNQVIHRDIKPGNILLDDDDYAYLTDFGIAKDHARAEAMTEDGMLMGTFDYVAPEQAQSDPVTAATDVYSLGIVLYEMLQGHHPFNKASHIEMLYKNLNESLPEITVLDASIRDSVNAVIQKATDKNPERRFQDVLTFAQALRQAAQLDATPVLTSPIELLTPREQDVLKLMLAGKTNRQIADSLVVELATIKGYNTNIYRKLGVRSKGQALAKARQMEWFTGKRLAPPSTSLDLLPEPQNPYKGLEEFQAGDAHNFFGRKRLTEKLLQRMQEDVPYYRFLGVVGPSGSGKSSLVRAGLTPALWRGDLSGSDDWYITDMLPGSHPLDKLEVALMKIADNKTLNLRDQLSRDARGLLRVADMMLPDDDSELLIVIDQFEEVFTLVENEADRQHFLALLHTAMTDNRSRVRVVVTLRADYYDRPLLYPDFGDMLRQRVETVLPLNAEELEQAITAPAKQQAMKFEAGLVSRIVADVNYQPGALPLLQYALTELFERRDGRMLTMAVYQAIGGTGGALAKRADEIFLEYDDTGRELVRQLFLRLVTLGEGAEDTRRRVLRSELLHVANGSGEVMDDIIDEFAQSRLLALDHDATSRQPTVEVAHEAILREWDTLRQWLNLSRDDIRQQRIVAQAATDWNAHAHERSYLLRGVRLEQTEKWYQSSELNLTPQENDYIAASIHQRKYETDLEITRVAEKATQEKRSRNLLRGLVTVLLLATLGAFALTGVVLNQSNLTQQALATSDANLLAVREQALLNGIQAAIAQNDLDTARTLSLAASTGANPSARSQVLLAQAAFAPGTVRVYSDNEYHQLWRYAALSPDEQYLVASNFTHRFPIVWDLTAGEVINVFPEIHADFITNVAFRPTADDQPWQVLTGSGDGTMILWDFEQRQPIRTFEAHSDGVYDVDFSPDGESIVSTSWDGTLKLWDTDSGNLLRTFEGHTDGVLSGEFSPDGTTILSASVDETVILWDVTTGTMIKQFQVGITPAGGAVFSPDGQQFAVGSGFDYVLLLWDIEAGQEIRRFSRNGPIGRVFFSQDGQTIFASEGDFITFWNIERSAVVRTLSMQSHLTGFVPNAQESQLISWSGNGTIRLWDLQHGAEIIQSSFPYLGDDGDISPDGRTFVVASGGNSLGPAPGIIVLFDAATGTEIRRFGEDGVAHSTNTGRVQFSPDGQTILSADWDDEIKLWNTNDGTLLHTYRGATATINQQFEADVNSINFAPDGTVFIAATDEGEVVVGDVLTGEFTRRFSFDAPVKKAIFNANGQQFLACLADNEFSIVLVDYNSGQTLLRVTGQTQHCLALAFAPDGMTAVSGDFNGNIFLWDITNGQLIRQFITVQGRITELVFSPDGQTVFAGSFSRAADIPITLVLWDVATGEAIRYFSGHNRPVDGLDLSADGRTLLSVAFDGTARLWRVDDLGELIAWTRANRYMPELSCEQRQLYRIEPFCEE